MQKLCRRAVPILTAGLVLAGCWHYTTSGGVVTWHGFNEGNGPTVSALNGADPKTFHTVGFHIIGDEWAIDAQHAWWEGQMVGGTQGSALIDPQSFKVLNDLFAKDKSHVFYADRTIDRAKPEHFKAVDRGFGYDENNLYYNGYVTDCSDFKNDLERERECESILAKSKVSPQ